MNFNSKKYTIDADSVREAALSIVATAPVKITPLVLEKKIVEQFKLKKKQSKSVIRELVAAGELAYTYEYGCTFLERSFARPVRVSKHVILQPPGHNCPCGPDMVTVQIQAGASFGDGRHPTTRLSIRGIEMVLRQHCAGSHFSGAEVLDVGCGSGVLSLISARLGAGHTVGVDICPDSLEVARHNVEQNNLSHRIIITNTPLQDIAGPFDLIVANLTLSVLYRLLADLGRLSRLGGFLIVSGLQGRQAEDLLPRLLASGWQLEKRACEGMWQAMKLARISPDTGHSLLA